MARAGVLARVLPGADPAALAPLVHLEGGLAPRWRRRLAVLGGQEVADRLRLSRAEAVDLDRLRATIAGGDGPAQLGWRLGEVLATDAVIARAALVGAPPPPGWQDEVARGVAATFPIRAADLMATHQGPALGARLKVLEERWLASNLSLSRDDLLG
jgi:poly(A) polymerase